MLFPLYFTRPAVYISLKGKNKILGEFKIPKKTNRKDFYVICVIMKEKFFWNGGPSIHKS